MSFHDVINLDILENPPDELHHSIKKLRQVLKSNLALPTANSEMDLVIELVQNLFIPLFEQVELEPKYSHYIKGISGATTTDLGMGSASTWHGEVEIRIRGVELITTSTSLQIDDDDDSDSII